MNKRFAAFAATGVLALGGVAVAVPSAQAATSTTSSSCSTCTTSKYSNGYSTWTVTTTPQAQSIIQSTYAKYGIVKVG